MFEASGVRGAVMVGHRLAYTLGRWSLTRTPAALGDVSSTLIADVKSRDVFWSTQEPLDVLLDMGRGAWWRWRVGQLTDGGKLTIRVVGDPEISGGP
jgi:hypothetical protein